MRQIIVMLLMVMTPAIGYGNAFQLTAGVRNAELESSKWNGAEVVGTSYFDLNQHVLVGPYLSHTSWSVDGIPATWGQSSDLQLTEDQDGFTGNHIESGLKIKFYKTFTNVGIFAGLGYTIISGGTLEAENNIDLDVRGSRINAGGNFLINKTMSLVSQIEQGDQALRTTSDDTFKSKQLFDSTTISLGLNWDY